MSAFIDPRTQGVQKFGLNLDIDTGTDPEDIWSQGGLYTFLDAAAAMFASSSSASDTAVIVKVQGLDANWNLQEKTVTLTGQTAVAIDGTWIRVFRAYVSGTTAAVGDVYIAETDTLTAGVPNTASKIKAKINIAYQQTMMCIYTVPAGFTGWVAAVYFGILAGSAATTKANFSIDVREFGGIFRSQGIFVLNSDAQSSIDHHYQKYLKLSPKSDIKLRCAETDKDNLQVTGLFDLFLEPIIGA